MPHNQLIPASRPVSATRVTLTRLMTQADTNLLGNVHGGVMMKLVDDTAGVVATRHAGRPAVTVSMDQMAFLNPVHVGDVVYTHAQVNWVGTTSLEIGVRVEAERWDQAGESPVHVASAFLAFVAVDPDNKPCPVPALILETAEDARRNHEAGIRRTHRLARRDAILASRQPD